MIFIKKQDYDFFHPLLDKEKQQMLNPFVKEEDSNIVIDNEEIEVDLYEWLNDLVTELGFDINYKINRTGKRLERISDCIFTDLENKL